MTNQTNSFIQLDYTLYSALLEIDLSSSVWTYTYLVMRLKVKKTEELVVLNFMQCNLNINLSNY